jgi:hypothetical protein
MNRQLRATHFRWVMALRWLAPALLGFALLGYRPQVAGDLPVQLRQDLPETAVPASQEEVEFEGRRLLLELFTVPPREGAFQARRWVRITLREPLRQPDVVVYWATRESTYDRPPLGSQMLGVLDERRPAAFELPVQASFLAGRIVLFSVGQQVLFAQAVLPRPI